MRRKGQKIEGKLRGGGGGGGGGRGAYRISDKVVWAPSSLPTKLLHVCLQTRDKPHLPTQEILWELTSP